MYLRLFSVLSLAVVSVTAQGALVEGDSFGIAMNFAPADQTTFDDANSVRTATFANGTISLGASLFDPSVTMNLFMQETIVSPTRSEITIEIFGTNALGDLANPLGDGAVDANGNPYTIAFVDFGVFNGAPNGIGDRLDINAPAYIINDEFSGIFNTAGELVGDAGISQSGSPDGYSQFNFFDFGTDIATADFEAAFPGLGTTADAEFAGWSIQLDITAVPEPTSMGVLGVVSAAVVLRRRRNQKKMLV